MAVCQILDLKKFTVDNHPTRLSRILAFLKVCLPIPRILNYIDILDFFAFRIFTNRIIILGCRFVEKLVSQAIVRVASFRCVGDVRHKICFFY